MLRGPAAILPYRTILVPEKVSRDTGYRSDSIAISRNVAEKNKAYIITTETNHEENFSGLQNIFQAGGRYKKPR